MTLLAFGRLKKKPSKELRTAIRKLAKVDEDEIDWDIGDGGEAFLQSYRIIRTQGNDLLNPMVGVLDDKKVYPDDREHINGFVLVPKEFVNLRNLPEDYKRPKTGCQTLLKDHVKIDMEEQPGGLLVRADGELIVRDDLLDRISGENIVGIKPVIFRGKVWPNWNRVRIANREDVIDNIVFSSMTCAACGQPLVATLMHLWIGKTNQPIEHAFCNKQGEDDHGDTPIIVISKDLMAQLRKDKMTGPKSRLLFEPLYSKKSKRYEVIRKIRDAIAK